MIVHPIGAHIEPPAKVSGSNPKIVVMVVAKIGVKRTSAALLAASTTVAPSSIMVLA